MTESADRRLSELFVRYWDNALTATEADELAGLLAADPQARDLFHLYSRQAVTVAELPAFTPPLAASLSGEPIGSELLTTSAPVEPPQRPGGWTRRGVLGLVGGGLAAAITVGVVGRLSRGPIATTTIRARNPHGEVSVQAADGRTLPINETLPLGAKVSTHGLGSSVVLSYANGSGVTLTGDSVVTISDEHHLQVHQGAVCAAVPPQNAALEPLTILTPQVTLVGLNGVLLTLGEGLQKTEVDVHQGLVSALRPSGEPMEVVRQGELLTVQSGGTHVKRPATPTPEEFAWDLTAPLPDGWAVGHRELAPEGPVVCPDSWPDPYWQNTEMYQIRSNKQWTRGFFRLMPDSVVRVRYRVDVVGKGQLCFCVRTPKSTRPDTGMLEWNGTFGHDTHGKDKPGEEQVLVIRAAEMLRPPNIHAPQFEEPWIGFLVIFNTYDANLGLKVAEFRVSRPGGPTKL